jgi:hypothetical protein
MVLGILVVDSMVLGSVAEAVRGEYGAYRRLGVVLWLQVGACQVLSLLLKR